MRFFLHEELQVPRSLRQSVKPAERIAEKALLPPLSPSHARTHATKTRERERIKKQCPFFDASSSTLCTFQVKSWALECIFVVRLCKVSFVQAKILCSSEQHEFTHFSITFYRYYPLKTWSFPSKIVSERY